MAKVELRGFQNRQHDVGPGDALRCQVMQEIRYGYDNEVAAERYTIEKVEEILKNRQQQLRLLD